MKRHHRYKDIVRTLGLIICFFWAGTIQGQDADDALVYRIGVSYRALGNINPNDAAAALKAWSAAIQKEYEFELRTEVELSTYSEEEIRALFMQERLDGVWITVPELMVMGLEPASVFVGDREGGPGIRYVILSHRQGNIDAIEDLADCDIVMTDGEAMVMAMPWLEFVLSQTDFVQNGRKFNHPLPAESISKAILQVFFKQADAAVVTREAFDLACELNPQLKKDLNILDESPPFISSFFVFRPSLGLERDMSTVEDVLLGLDKLPGGRQMLTVIHSAALKRYLPSILAPTMAFLTKHERVVEKGGFWERQP